MQSNAKKELFCTSFRVFRHTHLKAHSVTERMRKSSAFSYSLFTSGGHNHQRPMHESANLMYMITKFVEEENLKNTSRLLINFRMMRLDPIHVTTAYRAKCLY